MTNSLRRPDKGVFVISLDTELAWGMKGDKRYLSDFKETREVISRILNLFKRYQIKATWAVVGNLFLEKKEDNDIWHSPEIVDLIKKAEPFQEVGSHSFSHKVINEDCDIDCFRNELSESKKAADLKSVDLISYVYPKNEVGFIGILKEFGFKTFRGVNPNWFKNFPKPLKKIAHVLDNYLQLTPPTVLPRVEEGVLNIPGSYFFPHAKGWARFLPKNFRANKSIKGLRRAVERKEIFHLWFHPFNIASNPDVLLGDLEKVLSEVKKMQDLGQIKNLTMSEVVNDLWKTS